MIISRYILKEIITTLLMIVLVLLLIQTTNQFIIYLNNAASGGITLSAIFKLMLLQMPVYLSYLLPLSLFLSVLIVFGQLYVNQEMSVLFACGYSQLQLTKLVMMVAVPVAFITGAVAFELQPLIHKYQSEMQHGARDVFSVDKLFPKRFQNILQTGWLLYADQEREDGLGNIFLARHYPANKDYPKGYWEIVRAERLYQQTESSARPEFAYLGQGVSYRGQAGQKNFRVIHFNEAALRLTQAPAASLPERKKTEFLSIAQLWHNYPHNRANQVDFNWRLSLPFCALVLALWVVPLSHLNPRQGRYAKVFYASLICLFYLNMMFVSRGYAYSREVSPIITIWWIHVLMLLLFGLFIAHRQAWLVPFFNLNRRKNC